MSAALQLYDKVKELVLDVSIIKHFDYWNDNVSLDGTVTPYATPAVFFELSSSEWDPSVRGNIENNDDITPNQKGDFEFTLHLVMPKKSTLDQDERSQFEVEKEIWKALHFQIDSCFIEGNIQRLRYDPIPNSSVLRDLPIVYSVRLIEGGVGGASCSTEINAELEISAKVCEGTEIVIS